MKFSCIDPVYVWITCCNALRKRGIPLHWDPKTLRHPATGEELHGAGIQYSMLLRSACNNAAGKVALFNINWDSGSTGFGSRSCIPIHAQVMNTNSLSTLAVGLVGYLPYIPVPEGYRSNNNFQAACHHVLQVRRYVCVVCFTSTPLMHTVYAQHFHRLRHSCTPSTHDTSTVYATHAHRLRHSCTPSTHETSTVYVTHSHRIRTLVLQTCIGHVLKCIESRAVHGFCCHIGGETLVFFPRIGAMSLDTPERKKYFGFQNMQSCGICRKRKGRSLARRGTDHCPHEIADLYNRANIVEARTLPLRQNRKRARERLARHGFNYNKRCRLTDHAKVSLVQVDPMTPRLFGGLVRYERMHVYFIGYCTYLMELLVKSIKKECINTIAGVVRQCHQFRDPWTGVTHPRLPNILKMTHLTAERRVRAIFYWAHVLGTDASVVLEPVKMVVQRAVSTLQLILIAVRGHRAYTSSELDVIFKGVGQQFFMALEELAQFHEMKEYNRRFELHRRDPDRHARPVQFQTMKRFVRYSLRPLLLLHTPARIRHYVLLFTSKVYCVYGIMFVSSTLF